MFKRAYLFIIFATGGTVSVYSQFGFSHEVGVIAGPVAFQSDYGERHDLSTNTGNTGFGIGIVHYLNFAYNRQCNCYAPYTYLNDHFKFRTELSYNKTQLQHFGQWVDKEPATAGVQQLRAMRGTASVTDFGFQLEYFPLSIREFTVSEGSFAPFVSFGAHYNHYQPKVWSELGPLGAPSTTFPKYLEPSDGEPHGYTNKSGNIYSVLGSVGTRYKLTPLSDLMVDLRVQYYFSDWVDGLNPNPDTYDENRANDWLVWFNVGYIYYLDFRNGY